MNNTNLTKEFTKGIWKENPTFVISLGLCPTIAVTTSMSPTLWLCLLVVPFICLARDIFWK